MVFAPIALCVIKTFGKCDACIICPKFHKNRVFRNPMSDDIPFDKSFDLETGVVKEVAPLVRAVCVGNAGPFTFKGTVTYIVGRGKVAVIDPGPDDDRHVGVLLDALRGETVSHIVLTHTHRDHSPAAAALKAATGAPTFGEGPHRVSRPLHIGEINPLDAAGDTDFRPDVRLSDGDMIEGEGWTLEAITTPGHCANHTAYALKETNALFSGDHVMGWSTSIVAPPDGAMSDYMNSLTKIAKRQETVYFPGHGNVIRDAPRFVQSYIRHRLGREESILHRLAKGAADIPTLVRAIYIGIDPRLIGAAGLSVLAHLEDLVARGKVATEGVPSIAGHYRLA